MFDPANWYWLADDGRLYSSEAQALVIPDDPAFVQWSASRRATRWPVDDTGEQTDEALQEVLLPYGRFLSMKDGLRAYAADKRWRVETGGIVLNGVSVATDDRSKMMIMGARVKADADANFTTQWKTQDGFTTLDAATLIAISDAVLAHVDSCFAVEAAVIADIEAGDIEAREDVDRADWPS